jgi:MarR family transcriptional regulator, organic hydroperoxide resistance regulator
MSKSSSLHRKKLKVYEEPQEARLNAWVQLLRTFSLLQRRDVACLAEHGLTLAQFDVMASLHFSEGITQQELASRLLVTKGNVCGLLDRLEKQGWVERRTDAMDARTNRLHLTRAGAHKIATVLPSHDKYVAGLLSTLSDPEVATLRTLLSTIEQGLSDT